MIYLVLLTIIFCQWYGGRKLKRQHKSDMREAYKWAVVSMSKADNLNDIVEGHVKWLRIGNVLNETGALPENGDTDIPESRSKTLQRMRILREILDYMKDAYGIKS